MASFKNQTCMVAALGVLLISTAAQAAQVTSCRTIATSAADEWANGQIVPAGDNEVAAPDQIVLISYGHKYFVPRHMKRNENGQLPMLGELARERNQVYGEEKIRCLSSHGYKIYIYPN
jgi:hypothetical protein